MARRSKFHDVLDFEIRFYERLLATHPDFVDVLFPLAEAYTRRGFHEQGLAVDLHITRLRADDPLAWYNLACSYSLLRRLDASLEALQRSVDLGYADFRHLQQDPDLTNLRRSPSYRKFLERLVQRRRRSRTTSPV